MTRQNIAVVVGTRPEVIKMAPIVFALRDSELVRWSRSEFEQLIAHHPAAMLRLTREALKRYAATAHRPAEVRCIAVLPGTPGVDAVAFARRLARALPWLGKVRPVESLAIRRTT